jgi:signal transduction histidine kinase
MATEVQTKEEELREELTAILESDDLDYGEVVKLAKELAKQDPDNVRFSTDAAIIDKLGRELVSRQETAVAELIKNGYDADATQVELIFKNAEEPGGTLVVEDDGHGMTRQQVIDGFMRLSSRDKVREPVSPKYERQRVGEKGIGRFATQRLGRKLIITTQTEDASHALRVTIDWGEFEGGRDLEEITNEIEEIPGGRSQGHGTTLEIEDLRDGWTEATMRRVYRYVSDLVQPFPLSKESESGEIDPGFKVRVFREGEEDYEAVAGEEQLVRENALAEIEARVDENGYASWTVESSRLEIEEETHSIGPDREAPDEPFEELRGVRLHSYYFIHKGGLVPKLARKKIRDLANKRGGIRIYRNDFRVLPYGEEDDDWVGLDESSQARKILPPHANKNFFGFVEIIDPDGHHFQEKSSREGLINNQAFEELQDFVYRSIRGAVLRIAEERGKKKTSGQTDWKQEEKSASEELRDTAERLSEAAEEAGKESDPEEATEKLKEAVHRESARAEERAEVEEERESARIQEKEMLRVLASLGTSIAEFIHELRSPLNSALTNANVLRNTLDEDTVEKDIASDLHDNLARFQAYASYFDETVSENTQRELISVDLVEELERFTEVASPLAPEIDLEIEYENFDLRSTPMHPSEWTSILFNFFSNSRKAIRRSGGEGRILIRAGQEEDIVFIEFADNGDGIDEEDQKRIFNPFYTTTGPPGRHVKEVEELRGTGLGLSIVNDIVLGYEGEVYLTDPLDEFTTCFRVDIPAVTDEQQQ